MNVMKYFLYWKINYGLSYVMSNAFEIYDSYKVLEEISTRYDIKSKFDAFFKRKVVINRYITVPYIGSIVRDWKGGKGQDYRGLLEKILKYGENR